MSAPTVIVCDDNAEFRSGMRALLDVAGIHVAGEAADGTTVLDLVARTQPDIVLMDLSMPGTSGIEATRQIVRDHPHVGVVVLTMSQDDEAVFAAMRAGARGYLLKGARRAEIVRAVTAVADGEGFFGTAIASRLIRYFESARAAAHPTAFPQLSPREVEVLELMAGHSATPRSHRAWESRTKPSGITCRTFSPSYPLQTAPVPSSSRGRLAWDVRPGQLIEPPRHVRRLSTVRRRR